MSEITALIRTIGRPTLGNAIECAKREFDRVVVVADNVDIPQDVDNVTYLRTGQKFGFYGGAAINMGAYATTTDFFCLLDDDDEYVDGAGYKMKSCIIEEPDVDIWIPGLLYNDGATVCMSDAAGVAIGNIAVPTYRTQLLWEQPFHAKLGIHDINCIDFYHVLSLHAAGHSVQWYGEALYRVRPELSGRFGKGSV